MLLQAFWQILLLRGSPQTIPYSITLLGITLFLHLLIGVGFGAMSQPLSESIAPAALETFLVAGLSYLLLASYGLLNRLVQTVTAMAGCEVLIGVMSLPFNLWFVSVETSSAALPVLSMLLLFGWNVVVVGYILHHALGVSRAQGLLFAIGYVIISIILSTLFLAQEG